MSAKHRILVNVLGYLACKLRAFEVAVTFIVILISRNHSSGDIRLSHIQVQRLSQSFELSLLLHELLLSLLHLYAELF